MRRIIVAAATVAALVGSGQAATALKPSPTAQAPSSRTITAVPGQKTAIAGKFTRRDGRRPIVLQRQVGGKWKLVTRSRTSARGTYRISFKAPTTATSYRVVAPKIRRAGKKLPARTSPVTVVRPRAADVPGASGVLAYEVVALGSKTIERGTQDDRLCGSISSTITRQTTANTPTADSPKIWKEGLPEGGVRSVNIYPDVSSTYTDDLTGCKHVSDTSSQVESCRITRDESKLYPTDRFTVSVQITPGSATGEVLFFPPSARNIGYPGGADSVCNVQEMVNGPMIPVADRTQKLPLSVLLGSKPFTVRSVGIYKSDSAKDGIRTVLTSNWDQSITLRRVASR